MSSKPLKWPSVPMGPGGGGAENPGIAAHKAYVGPKVVLRERQII